MVNTAEQKKDEHFQSLLETVERLRHEKFPHLDAELIREILRLHADGGASDGELSRGAEQIRRAAPRCGSFAMLWIKELHIEDFGPFKGHQTAKFSLEDGVTVVYGENMRGKTSLLNAVRFAFFGKVVGRGTKAMSLHQVGNWEQGATGKYGFRVQLVFGDGDHDYKLTRSCRPRTGVAVPGGDEDYSVDYYLERDGSVLGPQQVLKPI